VVDYAGLLDELAAGETSGALDRRVEALSERCRKLAAKTT